MKPQKSSECSNKCYMMCCSCISCSKDDESIELHYNENKNKSIPKAKEETGNNGKLSFMN